MCDVMNWNVVRLFKKYWKAKISNYNENVILCAPFCLWYTRLILLWQVVLWTFQSVLLIVLLLCVWFSLSLSQMRKALSHCRSSTGASSLIRACCPRLGPHRLWRPYSPFRPRPPSWPCRHHHWAYSTARRLRTLTTCVCRRCRACSLPRRCSSRGTGRLLVLSRCWGNRTPVICPGTCPWSSWKTTAPKSAWNLVFWSKRGVPYCNRCCRPKIIRVAATETSLIEPRRPGARRRQRGGRIGRRVAMDCLAKGEATLAIIGNFKCLPIGIIKVLNCFRCLFLIASDLN